MEETSEKQRSFCLIKRDFERISLSTIIAISDLFDYSKIEEQTELDIRPIRRIHGEYSSFLKGISLPEFLKTLTCYYIASNCYSKDLSPFMLKSSTQIAKTFLSDIFSNFRVWIDENTVTLVILKDSLMYQLLRDNAEIDQDIPTN
ncbi:hypothetical protein JW796_01670 [Candidatus Dojkabacteria bacterium]|nr:hypothetical protein [Candidatus Dojkabacteria bacterium]